jgi:hypothetical protein
MTTDVERMRAIFAAIERTGRTLRVAFNYRYAPTYTALRRVLMEGAVGHPAMPRRGLLPPVASRAGEFGPSPGPQGDTPLRPRELVDRLRSPGRVRLRRAGLLRTGERRPARRAIPVRALYGEPAAACDPFALFLDRSATLRGLYLDAEAESGYVRDGNVFGAPITIEDTLTVTARYRSGRAAPYCLVAYAPWEGLRVAITGDRWRVELDVEGERGGRSAHVGEGEEGARRTHSRGMSRGRGAG